MNTICIAEDDAHIRGLMLEYLNREGFRILEANDGRQALQCLENLQVDLLITDLMMPRINGIELITEVRKIDRDIPVLIITAKEMFEDKKMGFLAGADDYMVKPIDIHEMVLRVNALLRRVKSVSERRLTFGGTCMEYDTWTVTDNTGTKMLPQKEFQLLYKMLSYPGQIFTRQQLLDDIWGMNNYEDSHTLDVHISRLRERFKDNVDFKIVTIRGLGYRVVKNDEVE